MENGPDENVHFNVQTEGDHDVGYNKDPSTVEGTGLTGSSLRMPSRSSTSDHFFEDFEGYSYGQYLNDSGKWTYHTTYDFGKATAIANPFSSLSPKCGMNVNPSTEPMDQGALLSPALDMEKGTLELWMATSHIDPTDHSTTVLFLFGTDSNDPDYATDRVLKVGFNYNAISYYTSEWGQMTGPVDTDTWYHVEISFDCAVQKCDITITDITGNKIGGAVGLDLVNGFGSVKRFALVTGAQVAHQTITSYWDDLLVERTTNERIETDENGGSWYDPLRDLSGISKLENAQMLPKGGLIVYPPSIVIDDFESYSDGESIIGKNGWSWHISNYAGSAVADTDRPFQGATRTTLTQHNPLSYMGSYLISKELFLTDCTIDLWVATSLVDPTTHTTTQVYFFGEYSNDVTTQDRIGMISFTNDGIEYYNGAYVTLLNKAYKETWYNIIADLDFSAKSFNITVKDRMGEELASVKDLTFFNSFPMLKALGFAAGKQTSYQYITSYWDDIKVTNKNSTGNGYTESFPIDLPPDCDWTSLRVDKSEIGGSSVSVRILDPGTMSDTGLLFNASHSEIDISGLNGLGINSVVLNATLTSAFRDPAVLWGWGVEWERAGAFRDSLLTSKRLYRKEKTVAEVGHIRMMDGRYEGQVMSVQLELPDSSLVPTLFLDTPIEGPTAVNAYLVKRENFTKVGVPVYKGNGTYVFHSIDRSKNTKVMLVMDLKTAIRGPVLRSWSLVGLPNNAPEVMDLHIPPSVNRTEEVRIDATVNDLDQPGYLLKVELMYLPPGGTTWETECLRSKGFIMATGRWDFTFGPTRTTPVGPFSIKVRATDEHGSVVERTYPDIVEVLNNRPTRPDIDLSPDLPFTDSLVEATILNESYDVESDVLLYTFEWYVNGVFEHKDENLSISDVSELSGSRFMKHDIVRCEVFAFDGMDRSDRGFAEVEVSNSPPRRVEPFLKWIEYNEDEPDLDGFDLSRWVFDPDSDRLTYTLEGFKEIEMRIDDEGILWVETQKDWFGNETVTLSVADQESRVIFDLTIIVRPFNDIPVLESIEYEGLEAFPIMGDIPDSFDEEGTPGSWSKGRRFDIRFPEERIVPLKVKAKDIETERMSYSLRPSTDVPFAIVQDIVSGSIFTLIPDRDAFGEFWVRLDVNDGDGGTVSAWVHINITNVNDPPKGLIVNPGDGQARGVVGTNITFSARVEDVDGDVLTVTWSTDGEVLATGETVNIIWSVPGNYDLECTVTDGYVAVPLGYVEVNVTVKPYIPEKDPVKKEFPVLLVVIAALLLLIVMGVGAFFIIRSMRMTREIEAKEEVLAQNLLPTLPSSQTPVDGQMLSLGLGSPMMPGALPSSAGSMIKSPSEQLGEGTPVVSGELPPASIEMMARDERDVYIRPASTPQRPSIGSGMMSAPIITTQMAPVQLPVQGDGTNLAPVPDPHEDMMKVGLSEGPPQVEETIFHDSEDHVWTPAMAESRAATEAKGAVDLLRELSELKEKGAISDEEFEVSKRRLLRKI